MCDVELKAQLFHIYFVCFIEHEINIKAAILRRNVEKAHRER